MAVKLAAAPVVVLAGNPNTGKSTIFNQLTGGRARVGNYPGVTVSHHLGDIRLPDLTQAQIVDSPGAYSLSARSADEQIAIRAIAGIPPQEPPALAVVVVDATQLNRNLYFALQVMELNLPVVIALNMLDAVEKSGFRVDIARLQEILEVPVVGLSARKGEGIDDLKRTIAAVLHDPRRGRAQWRWAPEGDAINADIDAVAEVIPPEWHRDDLRRRRTLALWALLSIDEQDELDAIPDLLRQTVDQRRRAADAVGRSIDAEAIEARYRWIDAQTPLFLTDLRRIKSVTDRIDRLLLQPVLGFAIFLGLMIVVFQSLFAWADPIIGQIEALFGWLSVHTRALLPTGVFADFLVDGVIGGVGSFVVFLPQIVLLFLFIGIMEDTGYMARVAVLMDRIMKSLGLHGRAFVPLISGYACAVPAIMATRTMERRRDRMLTMMVVPLMTCAARLPVYGLLIAAIVPPGSSSRFTQGLLMAAMYLLGTVMALLAAFVLSRTLFKGPRIPFLMEMPTYRLPHPRSILRLLAEQVRGFLTTAGSIILIASMVLWALLYFPRDAAPDAELQAEITALETRIGGGGLDPSEVAESNRTLDALREGAALRGSFAGRFGHALEPFIAPLGFDWKIGIGVISAFAAREVFVSTLGIVYGVGGDADEDSLALRDKLQQANWPDGRKVYTPLVCLSLMVFFALACQCMSTLAVVQRETRSWRWPAFLFGYMTLLAWLCSLAVYQGGLLLGFT